MIVGAQKAGTTSLLRYLGEHPELLAHNANEFSYFYSDTEYEQPYPDAVRSYFGTAVYTDRQLIAKHANLYTSEAGLERLAKSNSECKLILLLREPVSRAYSSYQMEKLYQRVNFEFSDLVQHLKGEKRIEVEDWQMEAIVEYSQYDLQLEKILRFFPKEQIRILDFHLFSADPLPYCRSIFEWIGVEKDFYPRVRTIHNETRIARSQTYSKMIRNLLVEESIVRKIGEKIFPTRVRSAIGKKIRDSNKSGKTYDKIDEVSRHELQLYFQENIKRLEQLSGQTFSQWLN